MRLEGLLKPLRRLGRSWEHLDPLEDILEGLDGLLQGSWRPLAASWEAS